MDTTPDKNIGATVTVSGVSFETARQATDHQEAERATWTRAEEVPMSHAVGVYAMQAEEERRAQAERERLEIRTTDLNTRVD
jgi:hypothetical protein